MTTTEEKQNICDELEHLIGEFETDQYDIRMSLRADDAWTSPDKLPDDASNAFELKETSVRYRMRKAPPNDRYDVNTWKRFELSTETGASTDRSTNYELVVDVPTEVDPEWNAGDVFEMSSSCLGDYPSVSVGRVAGLDEEKDTLRRFLTTSEEDWGINDSTGIVLEGPPGTGKTELVMEVSQEELGTLPVTISGPEILSKWVGESERVLREKFGKARRSPQPVVYIDELDAIARSRSESTQEYSAQIVAQLLVLLDGVEAKRQDESQDRGNSSQLKVIASTNLSHVIDPALRRPGRLGKRALPFTKPEFDDRLAILHHYLENVLASEDGELDKELKEFVRLGKEVSEELTRLNKSFEGMTGADIEDFVSEAVVTLREEDCEKDAIDIELLRYVLDDGGFAQYGDYEEESLDVDPSGESDDRGPKCVAVTSEGDDPKSYAKDHFNRVGSAQADFTYLYRSVGPKDLLANDRARAQENVIEAFQHRSNSHLALYLKHTNDLTAARQHSAQVDLILDTLVDQFLQWDEDNLLIIDEGCESENDLPGINCNKADFG